MKILILLLFIFSFLNMRAQNFSMTMKTGQKWYHINKNEVLIMGLEAIAGSADAVNQRIVAGSFRKNSQFWTMALSWKNKYKNYDAGDTRAAFLGSKTIFVGFTDGYHLTRLVDRSFTIGCTLLSFTELRWENWKVIVEKLILFTGANRLAFNVLYNNIKEK